MEKEKKVMGIIKNAGYGLYDTSYPCLYFNVYINESSVALQILQGKKADKFILAYGVSDVKDLNGKPVWAESTIDMILNVEPCIIN